MNHSRRNNNAFLEVGAHSSLGKNTRWRLHKRITQYKLNQSNQDESEHESSSHEQFISKNKERFFSNNEESDINSDNETNSENLEQCNTNTENPIQNEMYSDNDMDIDNNPPEFENNNGNYLENIFPNSAISEFDLTTILIGLSLRHSLSKQVLKDIIKLIETLAGRPLSITNYKINKNFLPPSKVIQYNYYCQKCQNPLGQFQKPDITNFTKTCNKCSINNQICLTSEYYFFTLDLQYQFKHLLERKCIQDNLLMQENQDYIISDIHNGEIYLNLKKQNIDFDLTFNFNTDGAPIFHSSKVSMWPIQIILNDVSPKLRFRNAILGGIWISKSEPNMNLFINSFVQNVEKIAIDGVKWIYKGIEKNSKIIALCCCVDSVARPLIQNCTQFNGFYGCPYCYYPGRVINRTMKYPIIQNIENRKHEQFVQDMLTAFRDKKRIRGVKGPAAVMNLPYFDIVWGCPIDYMHSILLGVVRQLLDIWTTFKYNNNSCKNMYIGASKTLKLIDKRLLNISPPDEIHRLPRSIFEKAKWKASEWRSWLLFYCIISLKGIIDDKYLEHFSLLQTSVSILLQKEISMQDLNFVKITLSEFVLQFQNLYGESAMTFNVHLLTHLVDSVKKTGPLWATSNFPFESHIYNIKKLVNGPKGVQTQIVYNFSKYNEFVNILNSDTVSETCKNFCNEIAKYSIKAVDIRVINVRVLGMGYDNENTTIYYRMLMNNVLLTSTEYKRSNKRYNSAIQLIDGKFCTISKIIKFEEEIKLFVIEQICEPFYINTVCIHNCMKIITEGEKYIVSLRNVKTKCIYVDMTENAYIFHFPNDFEIQ